MRFSELLVDAWVTLSLKSGDLAGALHEIMERAAGSGALEPAQAVKLARDLAFGAQGEVQRLNDSVVAVLGPLEGSERVSLAVGVSAQPFLVTAEGLPEPRSARALILVLVPGRLTGVRQDLVPALGKVLRDPEGTARLLGARSLADLRSFRDLMDVDFQPRLRVEDVMIPIAHRVHPDTPLDDVVDLMVRRRLHAVPVVGERYEVLGMLTSRDALAYLLQLGGGERGPSRRSAPPRPRLAREFMTRAVLCVSEEQSLAEAAHVMANRDAEELPVVREGELVGFITRDAILGALKGALTPEDSEDKGGKS
jgi:CBS domain-containing protein